jgi:hypothetical protein
VGGAQSDGEGGVGVAGRLCRFVVRGEVDAVGCRVGRLDLIQPLVQVRLG